MRIVRLDTSLALGWSLEICKIVRESSKCMDSATWGTYNELFRVIKFIINTKSLVYKYNPNLTKILDGTQRFFLTAVGQETLKQD
jgi:hypothetical protein